MSEVCEHGVPVNEDCAQCRAILSSGTLMDRYMTLKAQVVKQEAEIRELQAQVDCTVGPYELKISRLEAENTRLLNIIKGCPVCAELERNINTSPK
jgi:hypothetical protein